MQSEANAVPAAPLESRRINYVLIDHENVQPTDLALLDRDDVRLWVFVGAGQTKLSSELAIQMQAMRERADYVRISGNGPNALDFHIAFYIGQKAGEDPRGFFHIISRDTGFDPLVAHLKSKRILACRSTAISEMPLLKSLKAKAQRAGGGEEEKRIAPLPAQAGSGGTTGVKVTPASAKPTTGAKPALAPASMTAAQRLARMKQLLGKMKTNKPASLAALKKHIGAQFRDQVGIDDVDALIEGLKKSGFLKVAADRILY